MKKSHKLVLLGALPLIIVIVWLFWNYPRRAEMAAYAPAESQIYLEANNLPDIIAALTETDAWKSLARPAGLRQDLGRVGFLSRFAAYTGIGSAETVILSRAQVAAVVLGLDQAEEDGALKIKPRAALIVETHTTEWRARPALEKIVGDFARRAYKEVRSEQKDAGGVKLSMWNEAAGDRRIISAITGSTAIVGNDEATVLSCLAVRRGEAQSLADDERMKGIRARVSSSGTLSFGYVSPNGTARLLEVAATAYVGQVASDTRAQSGIASLLPKVSRKILGELGWSARINAGGIEDRYYLSLQNGIAERLRQPFEPDASAAQSPAAELLPAETYSVSSYNYRDPALAWRSLKATIASTDATLALFIPRLIDTALEPYGIDDPDKFLRAIGSEIVTARLDDSGESAVTIVEVRDEKTLRDFVNRRLGPAPRVETIGDAQMLISKNEEKGAASFIGGHLLVGATENLRRCLMAREQHATLAASASFKQAAQRTNHAPVNTATFTLDESYAAEFIEAVASQRVARASAPQSADFEQALKRLPYAVSETRLVEGGFERITRSSFGQFGTLVSQFK